MKKPQKTFSEKEVQDIRKSDFGVTWKLLNKWIIRMQKTAKSSQQTPINILLEVRRELKEKMGKFIKR